MEPHGGSGGGGDVIDHQSAKHLLDSIGKIVHDQVEKEAADYRSSLQGRLKDATYSKKPDNQEKPSDPCELKHEYRTNATNGTSYPCRAGKEERFSDTLGGQCTDQQIEGNDRNNGGACAPYRRLHLCNKNMVKMDTNNDDSSKAKHNLLLDVCMAAKYEGYSINTHYPKHQEKYKDTGTASQLCTVLARSFADIGDIVRGRDLFRGNKKKSENKREKEKLEENFKKYFQQIHEDVTSTSGKNRKALRDRYHKDGPDYYQLREDWWNNNRKMVWIAMTCEAGGSQYFRRTCSNGISETNNKCRCTIETVPTYFDYVPQYLRWFEEWAEDFCRKKKHKLKDAIDKCRGQYQDADRYCDLNGYDCEKTKRGINMYRWDHKCTGCFLSCSHFRTWIDNQKEQFHKQKKIYDKEITRGGSDHKGYEKKFYGKLKGTDYKDVGKFLEKLSDEDVCTKFREDEGIIDFKNVNSSSGSGGGEGSNKTFSHTEYCQACPLCGVEKESNGGGGNTKWKRKEDMDKCPPINLYKPIDDKGGITINFLYSGDEPTEIGKKLNAFCLTHSGNSVVSSSSARGNGASRDKNGGSDSQDLYQKWTCYEIDELEKDEKEDGVDDPQYEKDVKTGGGLCILEKTNGKEKVNKQKTSHEMQKTFNPFFYYWVVHMLKDSIHWRTKKLDKCINNSNESKACKNNKKCNKECECFQRWITQKQQEWEQIKKHFRKQKNIDNVGGFFKLSHDDVLQQVLDKDLLLKSLQEAYGKPEDIKHIKDLLEKEAAAVAVVLGGKDNTTIDKLLNHEDKDAKDCLKKQEECKEQERGGVARSGTGPRPPSAGDTVHEVEEKEEEEQEEEEEDEGDDGDGDGKGDVDQDNTVDVGAKEAPKVVEGPTTTQNEVNPCQIVDNLFSNPEQFKDACGLKYGPKAPTSWKCVTPSGKPGEAPSGDSTATGSSGSICVPPRRRRLYVTPLTRLAGDNTAASVSPQVRGETPLASTSASTPSGSHRDPLLAAFVESAAIETFFLWDRYKKEWEAQKKAEQEQSGLLLGESSEALGMTAITSGAGAPKTPLTQQPVASSDDPQSKLQKSGDIPPPFLRQMFYTIADYKDILYSGSNDDNTKSSTYNDILKGDKEMKAKEEKIKEAIQKFFENGDKKPDGGTTPSSWWNNNAKHIWNGMICALTYTDNTNGGPPTQDGEVKNALLDDNNKPKTNAGPKSNPHDYTYEKVVLKEDEENGPKTGSSTQPLTLKNFVERPPYFRYLEEWGEEFCRKQKHKLYIIEKECKVEANGRDGKKNPKCSCYGENCNDNLIADPSIFPDFNCPKCGKHCSSYRKWINTKKTQYEKQKEAYGEQQKKCQKENNGAQGNNGGNGVCGTLEATYTEAKDFLQKLGSCKNNSEEANIDFGDKTKTFGPSENCKPCSEFKINCRNGNCGSDPKVECNGKNKNSISANHIIDDKNGNGNIEMLVSDDSTTEFEVDELKVCKGAGIFEGIRKDVWKCGNVCGYNVCKPKNVKGEKGNGNQIIIIRALFKRWLEYFLQDYNKINAKISYCKENGGTNICIKNCADKWIRKKKEEWKKIKDHYLEKKHENGDNNMKSLVTDILRSLQPQTELNKAIKPCGSLDAFESFCGLNGDENSKKNNDNQDAIDCMITNLQKKIGECKKNHAKTSGSDCNTAPTSDTTLDDEDLSLEEENTVEQPKFCPKPPEPKAEEKGACDPAPTTPKETASPADSGEGTKEHPSPPPTPDPAAPTSPPLPPLTTALVTSTLAWSVGIGFAAFTYFFLKKKTKASVGNLFQILQIPKSDYDIPTKLSPNRYIPYTSGKYRGKRYIYLEGDSGTDSGYTDHYSDITSSSESEYEEMDINDIYAPRAPKYKTLIEVVLEPSKRDIPSDDIPNNDTPSSKITDNEWNTLKHDFISNMLQNTQNTEPNMLGYNVDNNTHPTMSRHNVEEKPFIMSIHDRNLLNGEEYSYNVNMVNSMNDIPMSGKNDVYSGIDLINDSLSGGEPIDIYDEVLKRKENELFGTNHVKQTSIHSVAKPKKN
ncbi:hypothetical protein PFNF54_02988 [Plasmodium falciparum NF54]|uniref:Erythrocyte membrane protein 1 n=1 Tax=Plasmodium falciparum (isolate NF54) TaxID=5843 RepID=W7K5P3_PLAFO|nr:hypothetical protein PFNF54_02988 [Plasmodium falciparum NF54]